MVGKRLSVRARLALLIVFVNAAVLAAAGYAWYALARLNTEFSATIAKQNQVESASDLARRAQDELWAELHEWGRLLLVVGDAGEEPKRLAAFKAHGAKVADHLDQLAAQLKALGVSPALAEEATREHAAMQARYLEAAKTLRAGNLASLQDADRAVRGADRAVSGRIDALVKAILKRGDALADDAAAVAASEERTLITGLALVVALALAISAAMGWVTIAMITRRLVRATEIAGVVAAGDLTTRIEAGRPDELGHLLGSLRHMNDSLAGLVARVRASAQSVIAASAQIASGNADLSARTEQQASSLEETAASMEEMTASVNHTSGNAGEATRFADSAAEVARRGGGAVDEVVRVMSGIRESSNRIGEIIGVIDSIAFQTNILALNAAVEAARAGEQGRGFAVVAGEVRNLAMRCSTAAAEVKTLITDSVERVQEGARRADDAGHTMKEVVDAVSRVSLLIREIAAATSEQSAGIAQVGQAVAELEKTNQHNASLAHQSNAAAESLNRLAAELTEVVAVFRTVEAAPHAMPGRKPPKVRVPSAHWTTLPLTETTP